MLTKKQQIKLILLTQDPKFGQLLADAIEGWKIAKPVRWDPGIIRETYTFKNKENPECCLLGAAAVNKEPEESFTEFLQKNYNSTFNSFEFIDGFDGNEKQSEKFSDAKNFAIKVREILFED